MDNTRWDTGQVLAAGVLSRPAPKTDIPSDRVKFRADVEDLNRVTLTDALTEDKMLDAPEYYSCVYAWSDEHGHHGRLMQYRNLTEHPDFTTAEELIDWFIKTVQAVAG